MVIKYIQGNPGVQSVGEDRLRVYCKGRDKQWKVKRLL